MTREEVDVIVPQQDSRFQLRWVNVRDGAVKFVEKRYRGRWWPVKQADEKGALT